MEYLTPKEYAKFIFKEVEDLSMQSSGYNRDICVFLVGEMIKYQPKLVSAEGYGSALFNNPKIEYFEKVKEELKTVIL